MNLLINHLKDPENIILVVIAFQYLFFSFFLFNQRKGRLISNRLFAVFMLFNGWGLAAWFFINSRVIVFRYIYPLLISDNSIHFLIPPLFFLYTISLTYRDFKLKKIYLFHLAPFLIDFLQLTIRYFSKSSVFISNMFYYYSFFGSDERLIRDIIFDTQFIVYLAASLYVIKTYGSQIKNTFSSIERVNLSWLRTIIIGILTIRIIGITKHYIFHLTGYFSQVLTFFLLISQYIFMVVIIYKGLKQPEIFSAVEVNFKRRNLSENITEQYARRLEKYMDSSEPYLDPDLTLKRLADKVGIPPSSLSEVINTVYHKNFFDFINSYRIEKSKYLLQKAKDKTVLEILFSAGFNSKSVFNRIFKQYTGVTPTAWKNNKNIK